MITNRAERDGREMKLMEEKDGHRLTDGQAKRQSGQEKKEADRQ